MEVSPRDIIAVFLGGGFGSVTRLLIGRLAAKFINSPFPWGTLSANILSSLILGLIILNIESRTDYKSWVISFVVIGFCGGFSTFSTFSYETVKLIHNGQIGLALLNVVISVVTCVVLLFYLTQKVS